MYSVLIVDDEELICKGLESMIERHCSKYAGRVCSTVDPASVPGLIAQVRPDIIITDIRMPDMTGLELIKLVSADHPRIRFIVLSGYDDFQYVKEAFKLGVSDYLLKPAGAAELNTVLEKVVFDIEDEIRRHNSQKRETLKLEQALMENKLNKLFAGTEMDEESRSRLYLQARAFFPFSEFLVGILSRGDGGNAAGNGEWIACCNRQCNMLLSDREGMQVFTLFSLNNDLILVANMDSPSRAGEVEGQLERLCAGLKGELDRDFYFAASNGESGVEKLLTCYGQAREALQYRLFLGARCFIRYRQILPFDREPAADRQLSRFRDCLAGSNPVEAGGILDSLFDPANLSNCRVEGIGRVYGRVVRLLEEAAFAGGIPAVPGLITDFGRFSCFSEIRIHLKTTMLQLLSRLREFHQSKSAVEVVKDFVRQNLHKDVDLAMAANLVSLSYSHFSKLFKEETGMNFSEYLSRARMEKALELLADPMHRVQDIAAKVGYASPKHFTRAFKNHFGFSPREYRSN